MQASTFPWVLGTGVLLGLGNPLARQAGASGVSALAFTLWPTALAAMLLGLLGWWWHGRRTVSPGLLGFGLVAGAFGHALPMLAAYWLAVQAGAGFASLSFTLTPVFTLAIMALLGRERLQARRLLAVVVGLAGGLLLVGGQVWSQQRELHLVLVALLVPTLIAATNVYRGLAMPRGVPDAWLSAATLGGSTAVLLALVPLADPQLLAAPDLPGLTWLGAQTAALVAGYLCYFGLQRRAEPVAFSLIGYVMLVVSLGLGHLFMAESVNWTLWPALALIALALRLMHRAPKPAAHP